MKPAILSITLILASCLLGACGSRNANTVNDAGIAKAVRAKLTAEFGHIEARQESQFERGANQQMVNYIIVASAGGVVTLTGEVRSKQAKSRAADLAHKVEHVVSVKNNLSVAPGYSDDALGDQ
jgi:hypothetical protein